METDPVSLWRAKVTFTGVGGDGDGVLCPAAREVVADSSVYVVLSRTREEV